MTTPPAAKAPAMPTTRPRITGVLATYAQPSWMTANMPRRSSRPIAGPAGMSWRVAITSPETMKLAALKIRLSVTGASSQPRAELRPFVERLSRTKIAAAGRADP